MNCSKCGHPLAENAKFCTHCGTNQLPEFEPTTVMAVFEPRATPKPRTRTARPVVAAPAPVGVSRFWIGGVIAAAFVIAGAALLLAHHLGGHSTPAADALSDSATETASTDTRSDSNPAPVGQNSTTPDYRVQLPDTVAAPPAPAAQVQAQAVALAPASAAAMTPPAAPPQAPPAAPTETQPASPQATPSEAPPPATPPARAVRPKPRRKPATLDDLLD